MIFKQPGANVIETVNRIKAMFASARGFDPAVGACQCDHGPDTDDPRIRSRRAVYLDAVDRPSW